MKLAFLLAVALSAPVFAQPLKPWTEVATPPLELVDLQGKTHRLSDYRGKVVLVNFWATWCAPCRDEMPSLERLRASLEGRPFALLAVNLGESEPRIRQFLDTVPVSFTVLLDRNASTAKPWQARILPATYVLGLRGEPVYRHLGELDWSQPEVRRQIVELMK
jgi:thiol-disulfide isomerase/thioredoxin